ncbi:MAG: glutamate synthase subunit alpha, partial [Hyphomicrobiaceae bacterium]|nr:glutamate synthase subunit alpha [Hyphomicrobiaceae bacterium]
MTNARSTRMQSEAGTGVLPATRRGAPPAQGLYNPNAEHDACGVGFVADLKARKTHKTVSDALQMLENLTHRGAVGADPLEGDGAGILIQIPHDFLAEECTRAGFELPEPGAYAVGHLFMPRDKRLRRECEDIFARVCKDEGLVLLGWRDVPVDSSCLSAPVLATEPVHRQVFIGKGRKTKTPDQFERRLYILRKVVSQAIYNAHERLDISFGEIEFYCCSLSSRTLVYKGM